MKDHSHLRHLPSVLFFALLGVVLLTPGTASAQYTREMEVNVSSFRPDERADQSRYRLRDGDVIMLTQEARASLLPDQVEIVLRTASGVTWWKEVKLTTGTYLGPDQYQVDERVMVVAASTQDRFHGPTKPIRFSLRKIEEAYGGIVFSKAKFLGNHTEVYFLSAFDLIQANMGGKRLTFTWQVD
jgi:hypothetical protein